MKKKRHVKTVGGEERGRSCERRTASPSPKGTIKRLGEKVLPNSRGWVIIRGRRLLGKRHRLGVSKRREELLSRKLHNRHLNHHYYREGRFDKESTKSQHY